MRSQFMGHFGAPLDTIDGFWDDATFVFDANVLLNLYRYSDKARDEFLRLMTSIQERSWLPEQCVHEYLSNRLSVTREQMMSYTLTEKSLKDLEEKFAGSKGHPFVSERNFEALKVVLGKINKELTSSFKVQESRLTNDTIRDQIADIFDGRVGTAFSNDDLEKLFVDGEARYKEEIPPGYKDGNKYPNAKMRSEKRSNFGDFVLWRQTMNWAKAEAKNVVFVTDDRKEDWWLIASGKTVSARPELMAEFHGETSKHILFYNTDRFLQLAKEKLGLKVSEYTISEIRQEHESRSSALALAKMRKRKSQQGKLHFSTHLHSQEFNQNGTSSNETYNFQGKYGSSETKSEEYYNDLKMRRVQSLISEFNQLFSQNAELNLMVESRSREDDLHNFAAIDDERRFLQKRQREVSDELKKLGIF